MLGMILRRIGGGLLTLVVVSLVVFIGTNILPGDATEAILGQSASPEAVAGLRHALGLDLPAHERYLHWLFGLVSGDPGVSLVNRLPVAQLIGPRLANSLLLTALTAALAVPLALLIGITTAIWRGSLYDRVANLAAVSLVAVPEFLLATIGVIVFAVQLHWVSAMAKPSVGSLGEALQSFTLPVLTLSFAITAQMARMTRAALLGVLDSSYIEMARLKGVRPARLVLRHALRNAAGPIANAVALNLSSLLGGVIIVEVIFSYPGLAKLAVDAVETRDMPLVQACAMIFCATFMLLVLAADICSILSNPRLRTG
ncbi:MAG TPA: ABC transporter permease [Xanthobacteraceae bacterium]|nr:ABC transporter permease [Xanthobacteraceae bacterium]